MLVSALGIALALQDRHRARAAVTVAAVVSYGIWLTFSTLALFTLWGEKL